MKNKFDVKGMMCASCQAHVQHAVENLNGVKEVNVNLLNNNMDVTYDENFIKSNDICKAVKKAGYKASLASDNKDKSKHIDYALIKLISAFILMLVLMYISMGHMWHWPLPSFIDPTPFKDGSLPKALAFCLAQLILTIPVVAIYFNIFIDGYKKLFKLHPNMNSLISIGASAALIYGIYTTIMVGIASNNKDWPLVEKLHMNLYYESVSMILTLVSLGKYFENLSKKKTKKAVEKLISLSPEVATIYKDNKEIEVSINDVKIDDIVIIKKGDRVPVDGIIIEGSGNFDESTMTGESLPVNKSVDDKVLSSSILLNGYIKIKATKVGEDSSINTIIRLVEEASNSKAPISKLVDKVSLYFVPSIFAISLITFICWIAITKNFDTAFNNAITVLVIACPCALGLATPVAIMVASGKGASNSLLIKNAEILEKAHNIKTVVLDKTGTITEGKPSVSDYISFDDTNHLDEIYSLEYKSEHPLSNAINEYCLINEAKTLKVNEFTSIDGVGIKGIINNNEIIIGNKKVINDLNINDDIINKFNELSKSGKTVLYVVINNKVVSLIAIMDKIKENSILAIEELHKLNIKVIMLTGDNKDTASKVGDLVHVDEVISEVLPIDKSNVINSLKVDDKHLVAMVGDGVNDALALTSADVGIAIGAGSDVALECADIVLQRNDLMDVRNAIGLSKRTLLGIKIGLFWAFIYNIICVIIATGIIPNVSINPMIGSIAMSISSVSVVLNALSINLYKVKKSK